MGGIAKPEPVKLFAGMIAREDGPFDECRRRLVERYGPVDIASDVFDFDFTDYYRDEMGENLRRRFLSFERLIDPADIAGIKIHANSIEDEFASGPGNRRVNIDPGYIESSKIVLASTKNFSHRIYLQKGIWAEVTLQYVRGGFRALPWTFPDYKGETYHRFFKAVREKCRNQIKKTGDCH